MSSLGVPLGFGASNADGRGQAQRRRRINTRPLEGVDPALRRPASAQADPPRKMVPRTAGGAAESGPDPAEGSVAGTA